MTPRQNPAARVRPVADELRAEPPTQSSETLDPSIAGVTRREVAAFVDALAANAADPEQLPRHIAEIQRIGASAIYGTAQVTRRLLAHDVQLVTSLAARTGPAAEALGQVRDLVAGLDPARFDLDDAAGHGTRKYAELASRAELGMERPLARLTDARSGLQHQNARIAQDERSIWLQMASLRRDAHLLAQLDATLGARIAEIGDRDPGRARTLRTDALFSIRQRRQEILTHLAMAAQGYAAVRVIERTNDQLIRTIDAAVTTTVTAVRSAALAVRATATAARLERARATLGLGQQLAQARTALDAVDGSELSVLDTMKATLETVRDDMTGGQLFESIEESPEV